MSHKQRSITIEQAARSGTLPPHLNKEKTKVDASLARLTTALNREVLKFFQQSHDIFAKENGKPRCEYALKQKLDFGDEKEKKKRKNVERQKKLKEKRDQELESMREQVRQFAKERRVAREQRREAQLQAQQATQIAEQERRARELCER